MKHTPLTDRNIYDINTILGFLDTLVDDQVVYEQGAPKIIELFDIYNKLAKTITIDDVKSEFWDLANEFNNPIRLKHIYEVKFKQLLNRTSFEKYNSSFILGMSDEMLYPFLNRHIGKGFEISMEDALKINTSFLILITSVFNFKEQIVSLLEQCVAFAGIDDQATTTPPATTSPYRITSKRKTDVIKILSAMYDAKMFVNKDDNPVTNKQKLMDAFGEFLGDDFSKYSALLSQSKNRERRTFMRPFTEIEKAAERYLEEE